MMNQNKKVNFLKAIISGDKYIMKHIMNFHESDKKKHKRKFKKVIDNLYDHGECADNLVSGAGCMEYYGNYNVGVASVISYIYESNETEGAEDEELEPKDIYSKAIIRRFKNNRAARYVCDGWFQECNNKELFKHIEYC